MSPEECIRALDYALAVAGQDILLRRVIGQGTNVQNIDVPLKALVRSYQPVELIGGIAQTDSKVIMSPTEIARAQWPGGEVQSGTVADPTLPRRNDKLIVDGRVRNVEVVNPIVMPGGVRVRIELRISG